jgi:hypothetical protein
VWRPWRKWKKTGFNRWQQEELNLFASMSLQPVKVGRRDALAEKMRETQAQRTAELISKLDAESFEESIQQLAAPRKFQMMGHSSGFEITRFYPHPSEILTDRRVIKLLDDFENTPPELRDQKCRKMFDATFQKYKTAFADGLGLHQPPRQSGLRPATELVFPPTQQAVCAAMLATGFYGSADTLFTELSQIDDFRTEVEQRVERDADADARMSNLLRRVRQHHRYSDLMIQVNAAFLLAQRVDRRDALIHHQVARTGDVVRTT